MKRKSAAFLLPLLVVLVICVRPVVAQALGFSVYLPVVSYYATPTPIDTTAAVTIVSIQANPSGSALDEYVEIRNDDSKDVQLKDWTLRDNQGNKYTFPSFVMTAGRTCRIFTGDGESFWCGFGYQRSTPVWDNTSDCAYLRDSTGKEISKKCYP